MHHVTHHLRSCCAKGEGRGILFPTAPAVALHTAKLNPIFQLDLEFVRIRWDVCKIFEHLLTVDVLPVRLAEFPRLFVTLRLATSILSEWKVLSSV